MESSNKNMVKLSDGTSIEVGNLYYESNRVLMDSYNKALDECRDEDAECFLQSILNRFEYDSCTKSGETRDELFARQFGDFVNGKCSDKGKVAEKMCCDHRYLQNEMFKVCLEYIKKLAENCEKGFYDPRNQYAAQTSKVIIDHLKEIDYPY